MAQKLSLLAYETIDELERKIWPILLDKYWNSDAKHELLQPFSEAIRVSFKGWAEIEVPPEEVVTLLREKLGLHAQLARSEHLRGQKQHLRQKSSRKVSAVVLAGEHLLVENFRYVLVETAEWLVRCGKLKRECRPVKIGYAKNYLVATLSEHSNENRHKHLKQLSNGLCIYTNFTPVNSIEQARKLLEYFGYSPDMLQIIEHND